MIAALYVVLVIMFNYCSFGPIQFRIAEALTILPYFTPAAIPGLFVGCLLSNILGGAAIWDIIFGSIATLIGAIGTYALRKNKWLAPLPPIIANTLIVTFVLKYAYGSEGIFAMFFVTIGASEFVVCGVIGTENNVAAVFADGRTDSGVKQADDIVNDIFRRFLPFPHRRFAPA